MENLPSEEWRAVVGWEGYYEVSNLGRVRSVSRTVPTKAGYTKPLTGRVLSGSLSTTGYPGVLMSVAGRQTYRKVHRLVAMAFIPNPDNYPMINHLDGNKLNPKAENLVWCDVQQNTDHAWRTGLVTGKQPRPRGEEHQGVSKFTDDQIRSIRKERSEGAQTISLGVKYGVSHTTISAICLRKTWKHVL